MLENIREPTYIIITFIYATFGLRAASNYRYTARIVKCRKGTCPSFKHFQQTQTTYTKLKKMQLQTVCCGTV